MHSSDPALHFTLPDAFVLAGYLLVVLGIGWFAVRRQMGKGVTEYLLAGRSLTTPVFVMTLVSTWYGGILGVAQARYNPNVRTVATSAPGATWTKIALESPYYRPLVVPAVMKVFASNPASASFPENGASFQQFFREVQTMVDPGDPLNHICNCASAKPLFIQKVKGDTAVPNSTTDLLINSVNATKLKSGVNAVGPGQPAYVTMTVGSHTSLLDPTASAAATVEMRTQVVKFAASANQPGGPFVVITNPSIVEQ